MQEEKKMQMRLRLRLRLRPCVKSTPLHDDLKGLHSSIFIGAAPSLELLLALSFAAAPYVHTSILPSIRPVATTSADG